MDFEEEATHFIKESHTWNLKDYIESESDVIPLTLEYNQKLIATFPTKTFHDFEPDAELSLDKAMIRCNDTDINDDDKK